MSPEVGPLTETKYFPGNRRFTYVQSIHESGHSGEVLIGGIDRDTSREIVIKRPSIELSPEDRLRQGENTRQEAEALRALREAGITSVPDPIAQGTDHWFIHGKEEEYPYLVTTRARGRTLRERLPQASDSGGRKSVPWIEVFTILAETAGLLHQAHLAGWLYNDVKSEHMFWDDATGQLTLIDWGNACRHREGKSVATDAKYEASISRDLQQMGEALYRITTGHDWNRNSGVGAAPPGIDKDTWTIVEKALTGGYDSAAALQTDLLSRRRALIEDFRAKIAELEGQLQGDLVTLGSISARVDELMPDADSADAARLRKIREQAELEMRKRKQRAAWGRVQRYLRAGNWIAAYDEISKHEGDLGDSLGEGARDDQQRLKALKATLKGLSDERSSANPDVAELARALGEDQIPSALTRYYSEAAQVWISRVDESGAILALARNRKQPMVLLGLRWLVARIKGEWNPLATQVSHLLQRFDDAAEKRDVTTWRTIYNDVREGIGDLARQLRDMAPDNATELISVADWVQTDAEKVATALAGAEATANRLDFIALSQQLNRAPALDPTNDALAAMAQTGAALAAALARLEPINDLASLNAFTDWCKIADQAAAYAFNLTPKAAELQQQLKRMAGSWADFLREKNNDNPRAAWLAIQSAEAATPAQEPFDSPRRFLEAKSSQLRTEYRNCLWKLECWPQIARMVEEGIGAWQRGDLNNLHEYQQSAGRNNLVPPMGERAEIDANRKWADWLDGLESCTRDLLAKRLPLQWLTADGQQTTRVPTQSGSLGETGARAGIEPQTAQTQCAVSAERVVGFLSEWRPILNAHGQKNWGYVSQQVAKVKGYYPECKAYFTALDSLDEGARRQQRAADLANFKFLVKSDPRGALRYIDSKREVLQADDTDAKALIDHLRSLEKVAKGLYAARNIAGLRMACANLEEIKAALKNRNTAEEKALLTYANNWSQSITSVIKAHEDLERQLVQTSGPNLRSWEDLEGWLTRLRRECANWDGGDAYEGSALKAAIDRHYHYQNLYSRMPADFLKAVKDDPSLASSHPFGRIYEQWAERVAAAQRAKQAAALSTGTPLKSVSAGTARPADGSDKTPPQSKAAKNAGTPSSAGDKSEQEQKSKQKKQKNAKNRQTSEPIDGYIQLIWIGAIAILAVIVLGIANSGLRQWIAATPRLTATPTQTETPAPTATRTQAPTATTEPSATPAPTPTSTPNPPPAPVALSAADICEKIQQLRVDSKWQEVLAQASTAGFVTTLNLTTVSGCETIRMWITEAGLTLAQAAYAAQSYQQAREAADQTWDLLKQMTDVSTTDRQMSWQLALMGKCARYQENMSDESKAFEALQQINTDVVTYQIQTLEKDVTTACGFDFGTEYARLEKAVSNNQAAVETCTTLKTALDGGDFAEYMAALSGWLKTASDDQVRRLAAQQDCPDLTGQVIQAGTTLAQAYYQKENYQAVTDSAVLANKVYKQLVDVLGQDYTKTEQVELNLWGICGNYGTAKQGFKDDQARKLYAVLANIGYSPAWAMENCGIQQPTSSAQGGTTTPIPTITTVAYQEREFKSWQEFRDGWEPPMQTAAGYPYLYPRESGSMETWFSSTLIDRPPAESIIYLKKQSALFENKELVGLRFVAARIAPGKFGVILQVDGVEHRMVINDTAASPVIEYSEAGQTSARQTISNSPAHVRLGILRQSDGSFQMLAGDVAADQAFQRVIQADATSSWRIGLYITRDTIVRVDKLVALVAQ